MMQTMNVTTTLTETCFDKVAQQLEEATQRAHDVTETIEEIMCMIEKMDGDGGSDAAAATSTTTSMKRSLDSAIELLGSRQDIVYTNTSTQKWTMAVFDGHGRDFYHLNNQPKGNNIILKYLYSLIESKEIDDFLAKDFFSEQDNPAVSLQKYLAEKCRENNFNALDSGATMVIATAEHIGSEIHVNVLSVGDSQCIVHCNGELVYETVPHSSDNPDEIDRLRRENRLMNPDKPTHPAIGFDLLAETIICGKWGKYVDFKTGDRNHQLSLAPTQNLGHLERIDKNQIYDDKGNCGLAPCVKQLIFSETDEINIKLFSDGVSDVVNGKIVASDAEFLKTSDAKETVERACRRWKQNWKECGRFEYEKSVRFGTPLESIFYNFGKTADDVSCASWTQTRIDTEEKE